MSVQPRRIIVKTHCFMKSQEWVCRSHPSKKRFDVVSNTSKCFHQNLTLLLLSRSAKVEFAKCRDYKTWNMGFPSQDESPALTVLLYSIWTNDKSSRTTRTSEQNIKSAANDLKQEENLRPSILSQGQIWGICLGFGGNPRDGLWSIVIVHIEVVDELLLDVNRHCSLFGQFAFLDLDPNFPQN